MKKMMTLQCRRCKNHYDSSNHSSKLCPDCREKKQIISPAGRVKATLQHLIASAVQLPYNQGYLQALVDFGHMEKTTLDEIYAIQKVKK